MKYKNLHQKLKIGNMEIENRLVMPPMESVKTVNGMVTDQLCDFYSEMTKSGCLGLATVEYSYVSPEGRASKTQVSIADDGCIEGFSRLSRIIHGNGAKALVQIHHGGSASRKGMTGLEPIGASSVVNPAFPAAETEQQELPREMNQEDINRIVKCFADAAERVKRAGFDGVEIHSAHGYLLNQFYSPLTNKRTDAYNGNTVEGRTRIHREIIKAVRERTGKDFVISIRFGACDYLEGGAEISDAAQAARFFEEAGADMISISGGMSGFSRSTHRRPGYFSVESEIVKGAAEIPVLLTGGIVNGDDAEALLLEGKADMIGIGRALLKDPMLPAKIMNA